MALLEVKNLKKVYTTRFGGGIPVRRPLRSLQ